MNTCQICGRAIKAGNGLIAHHGYRRPRHWGTQTRGCPGARHRPYEVACDVINACIEQVDRQLTDTRSLLTTHLAHPPSTLVWVRLVGGVHKSDTVERPADFAPDAHRSFRPGAYDTLYHARHRTLVHTVEDLIASLAYLRNRLADWKGAV